MMTFPTPLDAPITVIGKPLRLIVLPEGHSSTWPPALAALVNDTESPLAGHFIAGDQDGGTCHLLEWDVARDIGLVNAHGALTGALAGYPVEWGLSFFTTGAYSRSDIASLVAAVAAVATEGYWYLVHFRGEGLSALVRLPAAEQSDPPTHVCLAASRTRWTLTQLWRQETGAAPRRSETRTGELHQDTPPWSALSIRHVPPRDPAPCPVCDDGLSGPGGRPHIVLGASADALCRPCAERFCPDLLRYRDILWAAL